MYECARLVAGATSGSDDLRTWRRHEVASAMARIINERREKCRKRA